MKLSLVAMALLWCTAASGQAWVRVPFVSNGDDVMAYDSARGRVVLFSGSMHDPLGETWEWDGSAWLQRQPATRPRGRTGHAMAYDSSRRRIVMFGGANGSVSLADTWEWDGFDWVDKSTASGPSARYSHALAYDPLRQRVVLFGGGPIGPATTWEWDGSTWQSFTPATSPQDRSGTALCYDPNRQRVILFGGLPIGGYLQSDTWEWDGTTWAQLPAASPPPARYHHRLALDNVRSRVVLYGGTSGFSLADSWEWDGSQWTQRAPPVVPGPRARFGLAYDGRRQRLVLCGGRDEGFSTAYGDVWEWDGVGAWQQRRSDPTPNALGSWPLVTDAARGVVLGFGGTTYAQATWTWDGWQWRRLAPPSSPTTRTWHALAYDAARQRVVLFGGLVGFTEVADTWLWDGATWTQAAPAVSPPARMRHSLAYDHLRQRVVLFGGSNSAGTGLKSDTWEWDGASWSQIATTAAPSARAQHVISYDLARQRTVLFGGYDAGSWPTDTWEWDGAAWTKVATTSAPAGRIRHGMAFDPDRGKTVLFGGDAFSETWEWSGGAWVRTSFNVGPLAARDAALAWDPVRRAVLLGARFSFDTATWLYGGIVPSSVAAFGSGCAGSAGVPRLAGGLPNVGNQALALDLLDALATAPGVIALAFQQQSLSLGGGCSLYVADPLVPFALSTGPSGFATATVAVPADPSIRGTLAYAQAAVLDPLGGFAGLAFTGGLRFAVGD